jgi:hypothetical protein
VALTLKVECYAGYKADERPLRFTARGADSRTFEVKEILDRWYGAGCSCFKVRADDGGIYVLRHDEQEDLWTLDAFRAEKR